jgi:hypothetical protein
MVFRWLTRIAGLGLAFVGLSLSAQEQPQTPGTHMMIADPASLSGARAEAVYQSIKDTLRRQYMSSGDPVTAAFQGWRRPNREPYRSGVHGQRFVNHYANDLAQDYGMFESGMPFPEGSIIVKDSFAVTETGAVMSGPMFLIEKKEKGFNPSSKDWLFMMINPSGEIVGITKGSGASKVRFCADCHNQAPDQQDQLYFIPESVRRNN